MRDLLIVLIIFGSLPFILTRTYIGVLVYSVLGYMNPHRFSWGFAYNFPFSMVVGVVTIFSLLISNEPKRIPWTSATVLWMIWLLWLSITTLAALDTSHSAWEWERTMKIQLMIFVTLLTITNRQRINALIWVIVVSIGFYGVKGGIFTLATGGNYLVWGPADTHIAGNNEIAFALVMIFPLMRYLYVITEHKLLRMFLLLCMLLTAVSVIGSYSRGAFLSIIAMAGLLVLRSKKKFLIGTIMAITLAGLLAFIPEKWSERMQTIQTYEQDASAMGRINAWGFAINIANEHPVFGAGFDTFTPELFLTYAPIPDDYHDAHSIYFEVLAEHGYVGLIIFLFLGVTTLRTGGWIIRNARNIDELQWAYHLSSMIQVSIIGYAVGGAFLGLAYFDLYYHMIAILILLKIIVLDHQAKENLIDDSAAVAVSSGNVNQGKYEDKSINGQ